MRCCLGSDLADRWRVHANLASAYRTRYVDISNQYSGDIFEMVNLSGGLCVLNLGVLWCHDNEWLMSGLAADDSVIGCWRKIVVDDSGE